jgi:hypothetical protein
MTWQSVSEQDVGIRHDFPDFKLTTSADWIGIWEGTVRPASKIYQIRIVYFARAFFDGWTLENPYVSVYVVDPPVAALEKRLLPHVYRNKRNPEWPMLCLYDPEQLSWTPELSIAKTIIPWTSEWLFFSNTGRFPVNSLGPGVTHPEGAIHVRQSPRLQARRPAIEGIDF